MEAGATTGITSSVTRHEHQHQHPQTTLLPLLFSTSPLTVASNAPQNGEDMTGKSSEQGSHLSIMQVKDDSDRPSNDEPRDSEENATLLHHLIPAPTHNIAENDMESESLQANAAIETIEEEEEGKRDKAEEAGAEEANECDRQSVGLRRDAFRSQGQQRQQQQCGRGEPQLDPSLNSSTNSKTWNPKIKTPWRSNWKPKDVGKDNPGMVKASMEKGKDSLRHTISVAPSKAEREKAAAAAAAPRLASPIPRPKPAKVREPTKPSKEGQREKTPSPCIAQPTKVPSPTTTSGNGKHIPSSIKDSESRAQSSASPPPSPSTKPTLKAATSSSISSERRTSPGKPPCRFMDLSSKSMSKPPSSLLGSRWTAEVNPHHQRRASLEGERVHSSVKDFFHRRKSSIGIGSRKFGESESIASSEHAASSILARDNPDLGPFLLKLAKQTVTTGDNPQKALDYATRAAKSFENAADGKPSLDLVMSLHILAAIHCTLGQFEEAIPVLVRSIRVPDIEVGGQDHALAAFAGNMQLGDTYALLGQGEDALAAYHAGLDVQKRALGDHDPRVGETCRYLAEAHAQAMQFDMAEELCQHALNIHKEHSAPASIEEATDRRLMGLICNGKGQFEAALENLVLASMALIANNKDIDVATVDISIGDTYVSLGRFDEAIFAYQKALTVFKSSKGENHVLVASVYVSLAEAYLKVGKIRESKTYSESALRIYNNNINKQGGVHLLDEVASGLTDLAVVYESLNEQDQALSLLRKSLSILESVPGQQSAIAGVEAQIGVLSYMSGNYVEAHASFSKAIMKLRASVEKNSALFGIVLNQMGLCCLHLSEIERAVEFFEESRSVLVVACGPRHPDSLVVYSNLAGAYDALGRLDDAINALQYVVEAREEELGTAQPEADDERNRLSELLKEAGRLRARRLNNTLALLMQPKAAVVGGPNATLTSVSVNA